MARLNFMVKTYYNVIILGSVSQIMQVEEWSQKNSRGKNEVGFYAWVTTKGIQPGKKVFTQTACLISVLFELKIVAVMQFVLNCLYVIYLSRIYVSSDSIITQSVVFYKFCILLNGFVSYFKENLGMTRCVESFLVHHDAVGDNILQGHINFGEEPTADFIGEDFASEEQVCQKIIKLFSREHDFILDINTRAGEEISDKSENNI